MVRKKDFILKTPILFLVFNRLSTTQSVFTEIRKAKPKQLFIASDGPRTKEEEKKTNSIRRYILDNINWSCKVKTLFRKKNLGCKYAVSGAISWFFKNIEQGIILEDDCLPNQSFFRFCEEMLKRYKDEKNVMMISGDNFIGEKTKNMKESYYFSRNVHIWGWASWRRVWKQYKVDLNDSEFKEIDSFHINFIHKKRLRDQLFWAVKRNSTWEIQLQYLAYRKNFFCIVPKNNLIKNIGFEGEYTNTKPNRIDKKHLCLDSKELSFPLVKPKDCIINKKFDKLEKIKDLKRRVLKKIWIG
jgi:hypothetical protein